MANCGGRLRNIRFKQVAARILSIEHISRVLVTWDLETTRQNLSNLVFYIERAESPNEWSRLNGTPVEFDGTYEYVDYTPILFDLQKDYRYRVVAAELDPSGNELQTFTSDEIALSGKLDNTSLYIVEEHLFAHRWVHGVPALIYKKRFDGERCPDCWDSVLKKVTRSNCQTCFGTGKLDGYYQPISGWMTFSQRSKQATVAQQGVIQPEATQVDFTDYPALRVGDVIFEVAEHLFWRVTRITGPEKNGVTILQQFQASIINRSDIEYKLDIPQDTVSELLGQLKERQEEPEF